MKLNKPVTAPDLKDTILNPIHKGKDCLVIHPKDQRLHLKYLSKMYLNKLKPHEILWNDLESERTADILQHVNNQCPLPVYEILFLFTQEAWHQDVLQCIMHILYMLSGDAALSSVVPFNSHDLLLSICNNAVTGIFNQKKLAEMKTYSIGFSQLITLSEHHNCTALVVNFARCLVEKVNEVHINNRPEPIIRQIPYHTTHQQELCITSHNLMNNSGRYPNMKYVKGTSNTIPHMLTGLWWMVHATSCSQKYQQGGMDTCSYGCTPFMAIVMVSTLLLVGRGAKIHFLPCSNTVKKCLSISTMILHANYLSIV